MFGMDNNFGGSGDQSGQGNLYHNNGSETQLPDLSSLLTSSLNNKKGDENKEGADDSSSGGNTSNFGVLDASVQQNLISSLLLDKPKTPENSHTSQKDYHPSPGNFNYSGESSAPSNAGESAGAASTGGNNETGESLSSLVSALSPQPHSSPPHQKKISREAGSGDGGNAAGQESTDSMLDKTTLAMNDMLLNNGGGGGAGEGSGSGSGSTDDSAPSAGDNTGAGAGNANQDGSVNGTPNRGGPYNQQHVHPGAPGNYGGYGGPGGYPYYGGNQPPQPPGEGGFGGGAGGYGFPHPGMPAGAQGGAAGGAPGDAAGGVNMPGGAAGANGYMPQGGAGFPGMGANGMPQQPYGMGGANPNGPNPRGPGQNPNMAGSQQYPSTNHPSGLNPLAAPAAGGRYPNSNLPAQMPLPGNPQGYPGYGDMGGGNYDYGPGAHGQYGQYPPGGYPGQGGYGDMDGHGYPGGGYGGGYNQGGYGGNGGYGRSHSGGADGYGRQGGYHSRGIRGGDRSYSDYNRRDDRGGGRNDDRGGRNNYNNNNNGGNNGGANVMRDSLVEEFRQTYGKSRQWELSHIQNHIVAFCQDQHGSRFIQQRLEIASPSEKQLVFDEIIPYAISLMTDVFGNYVIQKLFEYGLPAQCETLASLLMGQSVSLSMQMYGCRVIQKALEYVSKERLVVLVSEFNGPQLIKCVHDQNGNHVIQKCIEIVSRVSKEAPTPEEADYLSGRIQFIMNAFKGQVKELSMHPYGCRVIQRILEHCPNVHKQAILDELRTCSTDLVQDQYGNYVIQHVMQHGYEPDRNLLVKEVQSHLLEFSQHKFASNVVEKCLQYANKRDRDDMIWTIINVTFDMNSPVDAKTGHCVLESMVRDPYANYVVQKVLDVSDDRQRGAILRYVKENIVQLRRYTYGKHIIVRLEKIMNEKF